MNWRLRKSLLWVSVLALVAVGLSAFFEIPYAFTIAGLFAWAALGHLVTLDDDMPGNWSNPDGSKSLWHRSLVELAIKLIALIAAIGAIMLYPPLREFGA